MECPLCEETLSPRRNAKRVTCKECGSVYVIEELADRLAI